MAEPSPDFATRLKALGYHPDEVEEKFARSSGPGGQHVNKVATAVTLHHLPTGVTVTAQDSRSQARNRELARERLVDALAARLEARRREVQAFREKRRRQNRPRPAGVKQRILESKKKRSATKSLRKRVDS